MIVFDTEGEYTHIMHSTEDPVMLAALERRKLPAYGVSNVGIYHLVGRDTTNPQHKRRREFSLDYSNLSPHAMMEILGLNEAQQERFLKAYDLAKNILMTLNIYPSNEQEREELLELDEMEAGFPRLTLQRMYDVVRACAHVVADEPDYPYFKTADFFKNKERVMQIIQAGNLPGHIGSWRKVQGSLSRLLRLGIFDNPEAGLPLYDTMTHPGHVTIIDLSDTDSPQVNNLVISEILRGVRLQQEENYKISETGNQPLRKVVIIIEEAHEFLSKDRIKQMPVLFQQVARIARRGRKRWLGLMFVTQLPQHLPDEVLGLINNYILHKIADANVISRLKRSIGGIDEGLWDRLPNLAPGQAIIAAESMARPLLVAIDPTPSKLRMID
ncbi:MAG: ATP-binding protein [Anaerolineales bacterium]|nr:ATP-binding protein [Anaerolineales bacterium]